MREQKNWEEEFEERFGEFGFVENNINSVDIKQFISKVINEVREEGKITIEVTEGESDDWEDVSGDFKSDEEVEDEIRADERKKVIEELLEELPKDFPDDKSLEFKEGFNDAMYKIKSLLTNKLNK